MGNFSLFLLGREDALQLPAKGRNVACLAIGKAQGFNTVGWWKPVSPSVQRWEPKNFVRRWKKISTGANIMENSFKSVF